MSDIEKNHVPFGVVVTRSSGTSLANSNVTYELKAFSGCSLNRSESGPFLCDSDSCPVLSATLAPALHRNRTDRAQGFRVENLQGL